MFGFEVRGREVLKSRHVRSLGVTNEEVAAALRCGKRQANNPRVVVHQIHHCSQDSRA